MLPDLSCCFGINFPARQRGELVADVHHGVTAFALAVIDSKTKTERASLTPDLRNEAVSFVHAAPGFAAQLSDIFVRMSIVRPVRAEGWREPGSYLFLAENTIA
jgi:hypothetical protein